MEVDKEFAGIFERSQMVSGKLFSLLNSISSKGRSHQLLKKAILKKENEVKKEEELREKELLKSIPMLHDQIEDLKEALYRKEEELKQFEEDYDILKELHKQSILMKEEDQFFITKTLLLRIISS